jgi:hypothetical protein
VAATTSATAPLGEPAERGVGVGDHLVAVQPSDLFLSLVRGHLVGGVAVVQVRGDDEPPVAREALHETPHGVGDPPRIVQHDDPAPDGGLRLGDGEP